MVSEQRTNSAPVGSICVVVPACALVTAEPTPPLAEPVELCWLWNSAGLSVSGFLLGLAEMWSKVVDAGGKKNRWRNVGWKGGWGKMMWWGSTATGYQHSTCLLQPQCMLVVLLLKGCHDLAISMEAWESEDLSSALVLTCHITSRKSPRFSCSVSPSCL